MLIVVSILASHYSQMVAGKADSHIATGIAAVGGGTRLGNMALGLYSQGQRALPHGTCPAVGIGGHFTQ